MLIRTQAFGMFARIFVFLSSTVTFSFLFFISIVLLQGQRLLPFARLQQ